jgi:MFS family permease
MRNVDRAARRTLILVAAAELLGTSLWLSGTAAIPELTRIWRTDLSVGAWLTMSVQLGFVTGALTAAIFNLPDIFKASRLFAVCAVAAAIANAGFAWVAPNSIAGALALRFLTGAFLAGIYPVGMKLLSGWFRDGRGTALGILVGALTVGKAAPYAVEGASALPWQWMALVCSGFALLSAVLIGLGVHEGPYSAPQPPLDLHQVGAILHNRPLRLANFGYFGHMWELYSMWGWIALMLGASAGAQNRSVAWGAFAAIASGAIGCYWAGRVADHSAGVKSLHDRVARRARVTIIAMAVSGACCLLAALVFEHFWLLFAVSIVWGIAVVADSAQFSAIVSEVSDRRYVGTALALQTAVGFLLTVASIRVIGAIGEHWGWPWAAAAMSIGPAVGILAMRRLQIVAPD